MTINQQQESLDLLKMAAKALVSRNTASALATSILVFIDQVEEKTEEENEDDENPWN